MNTHTIIENQNTLTLPIKSKKLHQMTLQSVKRLKTAEWKIREQLKMKNYLPFFENCI